MRAKTAGAGAALAAGMLALLGCTLTKNAVKPDGPPVTIGGGLGGEVVAPKRCVLRVMVAARPEGDHVLDEAVWRLADEQAIEPEARRVLQANGLRLGRIAGELPPEVRAVLDAAPPRKIEPSTVILPDGDHTLLDPGTAESASLHLFLNQNDRPVGKSYTDARGFIRLVASYDVDSPDGVLLRLTPELHHGAIRRDWGVAEGATPMTPQQLIAKASQKEDTFRDLAASLVARPGQVVVIGGRHELRGSLGDYLFGGFEDNSDRPVHKVVFLWASHPTEAGPEAPKGLVPVEPESAGR